VPSERRRRGERVGVDSNDVRSFVRQKRGECVRCACVARIHRVTRCDDDDDDDDDYRSIDRSIDALI
jgi:hypothetical protein